ncbi:MAG: 23S rRNA (adenine(2503)-C(2))-methyltransferase RlmN, partial [bacterium]|nr:23S rRNA (adenine(2503)-C(2))-methyltransferase RlmN [bacterium]
MDLKNLEKTLEKEPKYRLVQAKSAVFKDLAEDWQEAKTLPQELRKKLEDGCPLRIEASVFGSMDGPSKALFVLEDGLKIESVLLRHEDGRNTVCVSSQVGCALCCEFCATGQLGFKRNLNYSEIIEQVLFFARLLKKEKPFDTAQGKITNVVFMGMGEPFLNYDNVLMAIKTLNDKDGFNLGSRHFSVSTVGIIEGIEKLSEEDLQINLAVSLHAPDDKLREKIMPINKKYPLEKILEAVRNYIKKTKRRVMFEYIMIKDVNDSEKQAAELAGLLKN